MTRYVCADCGSPDVRTIPIEGARNSTKACARCGSTGPFKKQKRKETPAG